MKGVGCNMSAHIDWERVHLTEASKVDANQFEAKMAKVRECVKRICAEPVCAKCGNRIDKENAVEIWNARWKCREKVDLKGVLIVGSSSYHNSIGHINVEEAGDYVERATFVPGLRICHDCFDKYIAQYNEHKHDWQCEMQKMISLRRKWNVLLFVYPLIILAVAMCLCVHWGHPVIGVIAAIMASVVVASKCAGCKKKCAEAIFSLGKKMNKDYDYEGLLKDSFVSQKLFEFDLAYDGVEERCDSVPDYVRNEGVLMHLERKALLFGALRNKFRV